MTNELCTMRKVWLELPQSRLGSRLEIKRFQITDKSNLQKIVSSFLEDPNDLWTEGRFNSVSEFVSLMSISDIDA